MICIPTNVLPTLSVVASYWDGPKNISFRYSCTCVAPFILDQGCPGVTNGYSRSQWCVSPELGHRRHGSFSLAPVGHLLWRKPVPCMETLKQLWRCPQGEELGSSQRLPPACQQTGWAALNASASPSPAFRWLQPREGPWVRTPQLSRFGPSEL